MERLRDAFLREGPMPHNNGGDHADDQHQRGKSDQHNLFDVHGAAHHPGLCFLFTQARK